MFSLFNRDIFRYPAVQYIPLTLIDKKVLNYPVFENRPVFFIFNTSKNNLLNRRLKRLNYTENYNIGPGQLGILVFNGIIDVIKYRGHEVLMIGIINRGQSHLFKITTKYFYKEKIIINFYNKVNGEILDRKNYSNTTKLT